ncbi:permease prefix domain 1-containing protein [uncultured Dysosmobacter sp.]|uniref:permease prefix domain 1-containing protein n=1 Tax=uncultured Dysosmobacter sp. TaxID=2591384 RepID=UPI0026328D56|nr:permease prefix domain 1-containing protein [uncultured Dysosmobacter sp.]
MTRREYTARVLICLRRVTRQEREAIQAEIDGHMEDHICALLGLGYPPELAEERTLALMGDPAEVGQELNRQYPFRWLAVKWGAIVLMLALALLVARPAWTWAGVVSDNLWNRFAPTHQLDLRELSLEGYVDGKYVRIASDVAEVDLRQTDGGVTMRVYQAGLEVPLAPKTEAWVSVCLYSENPFGETPQIYGDVIDMTGPLGREVTCTFFSGVKRSFTVRGQVRRGEELRFTYEQYGHRFDFSVPLPWGEALS